MLRPMHLSVIGSGYVGSTIAACFADLGHDVVNIDVLFHLAALSSRNMHENDPQRGCRVNRGVRQRPRARPRRGL